MALGTTGITTSAVGNAIGSTSRDVGTLCTSTLINPWSRWKPIAHTATTMTWELMDAANYGISILSGNSPTTLYNAVVNNGNLGYTYNKPTSTTGYRLGDFRNYQHNASLPIGTSYSNGDKVNIGGVTSTNHSSYVRYLSGVESVEGSDTSIDTTQTYISQGDIYTATDRSGNRYDLKRGALITNGTYTYWSTDYIPWAETNWQKFKGSTCTVFEFLTNVDNNPDNIYTATADDVFFALPEPIKTISVTSSVPSGSRVCWYQCECTFTDDTCETIKYELKFSAVGDAYRGGTITNVHIGYYEDIKGLYPISSKKIADSITIPNQGTSSTYTGTLLNFRGMPNGYILVFHNNAVQYTTMVIQSVLPL